MKILIIADQEGCLNVSVNQTLEERNRQMQHQIDHIIRTINPEWEIVVLDCHDNGLNLLPLKKLFPKVKFVSQIWNFNINDNYDCAILVGFHAAKGEKSPFSHTFRSEIKKALLNNQEIGEVTLISLWLQSYGIPILWVNGEDILKKEVLNINLNFVSNNYIYENKLDYSVKQQIMYLDNKPIKIEFIYEKLLDAFPPSIFKLKDKFVEFDNISDFLLHLSELSIFLNAAKNYHLMYIKKLINKIRWNYTKKDIENLKDEHLNLILNKTSFQDLTKDDYNYLEKTISLLDENRDIK